MGPSGRCDPSINRIARMVGVARNTVLRAIEIGERMQLFRKVRRWKLVPVELEDGSIVHRRRQATNLYLFNPAFGKARDEEPGRDSKWRAWIDHLSGLRSPVQMALFAMTRGKPLPSEFRCGTGKQLEEKRERFPAKSVSSGDNDKQLLAEKLAHFSGIFERKRLRTP
jgi:hypothetical protein